MSTLSTPGRPPADEPGGEGGSGLGADPPNPVGDGDGSRAARRRERALLLVTLVLILAASAAFVRAQTGKLEPSPLKRPRVESVFSPRCDCAEKATATLSFTLRRTSLIDAQIIDPEARVVRTLADDEERPRGRLRFEWDGRDDAGRLVPDAAYRLRLNFDGEREVVVPQTVTLDTQPPRGELLSISPRVFVAVPRGNSRRARRQRERSRRETNVDVRYRSDEIGHAILLVNGRPVMRGARRSPGDRSLRWNALLDGRPLGPGRYLLAVRLRDRAGNSSAPTRGLALRVRRPAGP